MRCLKGWIEVVKSHAVAEANQRRSAETSGKQAGKQGGRNGSDTAHSASVKSLGKASPARA